MAQQQKEPSINQKTNFVVHKVAQVEEKIDAGFAALKREIGAARDATIAAAKKPERLTDRFLLRLSGRLEALAAKPRSVLTVTGYGAAVLLVLVIYGSALYACGQNAGG